MKVEKKSILPIVLTGVVVHGKALGRTVGMPTANISVDMECLPEAGVYATRIEVDGDVHVSVTNIGNRPSVDDSEQVTVETHILDFEKDIYGKNVVLEICKFLRPVVRFESLKAVREQVNKDILEVKKYFT